MPNNLSLSWDILPERKAWSVQLFESIGEKSGIPFGGSSNAGCGQLEFSQNLLALAVILFLVY